MDPKTVISVLFLLFYNGTGYEFRLEGGVSRCEGRLELDQGREWRGVDWWPWYWTQETYSLLCKHLECGSHVSSRWTDGEDRPVWLVRSTCTGPEADLNTCLSVVGEGTSTVVRELTCSGTLPTTPPTSSPRLVCLNGGQLQSGGCICPDQWTGDTCSIGYDVRLEGGVSRCEGRLELYQRGEWRGVVSWDWTQETSSVMCKHLGCGSHLSSRRTRGERRPVWEVRSTCTGAEADLNTCLSVDGEGTTTTVLEVTCSAPEFSECGILGPTIADRVVTGRISPPASHPWQASLQELHSTNFNKSFEHFCGGVLIGSCWVLTAAHCIVNEDGDMRDAGDLRVQLGGVNIKEDEPYDQTIDVKKVIVHELYTNVTADGNDIALLQLKSVNGRCAKETRFVKTACLPSQMFPDNTECVVSGWGKTMRGNGTWVHVTKRLLSARVPLISHEDCDKYYSMPHGLKDSMLCAGKIGGGVDACGGDSGGPLMCDKNGTHYVTGVVSWGPDECDGGGVYTNVALFVNWITNQTSNML